MNQLHKKCSNCRCEFANMSMVFLTYQESAKDAELLNKVEIVHRHEAIHIRKKKELRQIKLQQEDEIIKYRGVIAKLKETIEDLKKMI